MRGWPPVTNTQLLMVLTHCQKTIIPFVAGEEGLSYFCGNFTFLFQRVTEEGQDMDIQ